MLVPTSTTKSSESADTNVTPDVISKQISPVCWSIVSLTLLGTVVLQDSPPAAKRVKVDTNSEINEDSSEHIKQSHLHLDDLPPELLPVHYENMLKKVCLQCCMHILFVVYMHNSLG